MHIHFITIASTSGIKPRINESVYVASKFAQVDFTRSLGIENSNKNIKISLILPGSMKTNFWQKYPNKDYHTFLDPNKVSQKIIDFINSQTLSFDEIEIPRGSL